VFLPNQKNAKAQCEEQKAWLQSVAEKVAGRPVSISVATTEGTVAPGAPVAPVAPVAPGARVAPAAPVAPATDVKEEAMANSTVQAVLEIFPVEKTTIEER
jgi:hypothetical protein